MTISYGHACSKSRSKSLLLDAGDSLNSSLVAIVAVEPEVLKAWAASEGIQVKDVNHNVCHLFISSFKKNVCKYSDTDPTYNIENWRSFSILCFG